MEHSQTSPAHQPSDASGRPDLTGVPITVVQYIDHLEEEIAALRNAAQSSRSRGPRNDAPAEPSEPPTTMQVISISQTGLAKRTPRHLYIRQRRGGMGVFDLEGNEDDPPAHLVVADESQSLVVITNEARAFRIPVSSIDKTDVRGRGSSILSSFPLKEGESLAVILAADQGQTKGISGSHVVLVSERGQVRRIASHYFGDNLQPGTVLYNVSEGGAPAAACWSTGDQELFLITRAGQAIRFAEKQVPVRGCLGMRVDPSDRIVGAAAVNIDGGVFIATDEGKGTVRLMAGFTANKSPGAGGKVGIKSDVVTGATAVGIDDDIFMISRLGKIIRFQANEIPAKEGVVQGVNCMSLRADECTGISASIIASVRTAEE